jgi:murein DD-endopeptidase MepM/ murein hydrolase activator NlpD
VSQRAGRARPRPGTLDSVPVIVIRHDLSAAENNALGAGTATIYSMYGQLGSLAVAGGDSVSKNQAIASVLDQGTNSHLHWEMRTTERHRCGTG